MVKITSFEDTYYYPHQFPELEELVRFPDGEFKRKGIPNSTVWVFNAGNHTYVPEILGRDVGCGMAGFLIPPLDAHQAADLCYEHLQKKKILGRGNHFVDICSSIEMEGQTHMNHQLLLVHTHGKDNVQPRTVQEATSQQKMAAQQRLELGYDLTRVLKVRAALLQDWPHNTIEEDQDKIIYRKGVVKVEAKRPYILPAHLGAKILVYTVSPHSPLPYSSMPHATGRRGSRGAHKVSEERAAEVRKVVYVPQEISSSSLRSEHPSCYNGFDKIFDKLLAPDRKYFIPIGETRILSYVGKV